MTDSNRQVFVVSTGRCGSTLLSKMLGAHPAILSLSEVFMAINTRAFVYDRLDGGTFWKLLSKPRRPMSEILTPETCPKEFKYDFACSNLFTQETLPPILYMALPSITDDPDVLYFELEAIVSPRKTASLAEHYQFMFDWFCQRLNKKLWVERSGASLIFVDALSRMYPHAKFIHLYRDGRDTALSMRAYPPLNLLAQSWDDARKVGVNLLEPPFRIGDSAFVSAVERFLAPVHGVKKRLAQPADVKVVGEFWSALTLAGLNSLATVPDDRKFSLSYENLTSHPRKTLFELLQFIDPALPTANWLDGAVKLIEPTRSRRTLLAASERHQLENACSPGLKALGYLNGSPKVISFNRGDSVVASSS